MLITGEAILRERNDGRIVIAPFDPKRVRAASYVLSLGRRFRRWRGLAESIVVWSPEAAGEHLEAPVETDSFTVHPGDFVLGCTLEAIGIAADLAGRISALSHIARFGLGVHGGSDFISPGFGLRTPTPLTLEIFNRNSSPLTLKAGMPVIHLRLERLASPTEATKRTSIYEGADPLTGPMLFEEWAPENRASDDA
jgi:dCTP deaminase